MGGIDFIVIILVLVIAQASIAFFSKDKGEETRRNLQNLWWYHLFFGILYMLYVLNFGGDAVGYWKKTGAPLEVYLERGPGTAFIHAVNYYFVHNLSTNFLTGSVIYSFIGYLGMLFFYLSFLKLLPGNVKFKGVNLFPAIFFLPNFHFWSAGVGKDTLSFFCIGLFLYSILSPGKRFIGIIISVVVVYYVRPHIAMFLLTSFGLSAVLDPKLGFGFKALLTAVFLAGAIFMFDDVMEYVRLDEVSAESFENYSNYRVGLLSRSSGSSVDISSYPLPLKIFTFLFRPLFFDVRNITSLLASFENLLMLILIIKAVKSKFFSALKKAPFPVKGLIIFVIIGALGFSNTMGNLGIMLRMKNMFTPGIIMFILYTLSYERALLLHKLKLHKLKLAKAEMEPSHSGGSS